MFRFLLRNCFRKKIKFFFDDPQDCTFQFIGGIFVGILNRSMTEQNKTKSEFILLENVCTLSYFLENRCVGEVVQMVERSLSMREAPGSIPGFSNFLLKLFVFLLKPLFFKSTPKCYEVQRLPPCLRSVPYHINLKCDSKFLFSWDRTWSQIADFRNGVGCFLDS